MRCDEFRREYGLLVDVQRTRDLPQDLAAHLAGCAACSKYARAMTAVDGALRSLPNVDMPPELLAELYGIPLNEVMAAMNPKKLLLKGAAILAGALVALGLGTLLPQAIAPWVRLAVLTAALTLMFATILKVKHFKLFYD
jgi:anti-sigma factor RsiW